ncbi:MAG: glycosyl hydrolase, partial [Planctomycetota bacterium]|nr:glycosyl hydrolase [Planctomycetota bacterium]
MENLEVRTLLAADLMAAGSHEDIAGATSIGAPDSATIIQSLIDSGAIASSPSPGLPTPGDFQGNPLQPIVTDTFSQAVPSNDWWSSVHFAEYGDAFSAPLFIHPITAKATEPGISLSAQTIQSSFETGPTLREFQVAFVPDVHIDLFGSGAASEFALDSYSDWAFTGKWKGIDDSPSTTMAQGSPMVWIEDANFSSTKIRWDDGGANVTVNGDTAILTVADRTYGLYAPSGSAWQISGQSASLTGNGSGNIAIALLPGTEAGTLTAFRQAANQPITGTSFTYGRGEDPYSLTLNYDYSLSGNGNGETVVALYPHLARQTNTENLPSADYSSARGNMPTVQTSSIQANVKSRGVLPALPSTLDSEQVETLRQLLLTDEAATNPSGYFSRFADPYWSGKSMLKLMQLSQVAEVVGETAVRDQIHEAVKAGLEDWFNFNGNPNDRHFAYNAQWDTLQGYPDAFYSGQMLNDHHFHMGYLVHAAALVGMQDPAWAAENQTVIDLIIKDVAGTDAADTMLPRLRNFSPMAGHSWASGHGAFTRGNNHESSSEAMNFATGLMLWGEVTGQQDTTLLGQTLYSLEAEAIAEYWFDKYGTTYPEEFDVESVGMVWGDGATHATWFSAEVEMIRAINFLPFHGGSLYLSEMARDGEALIDDIERLNGGPPDVWQSLISQYEVMVSPEEAWDKFSLQENQPEEGQSAAFTYYWMATLANLGTPTSDIRGDHPLSAVFQNDGANTYTAYNAGTEPITVTFNDGVSFSVAAGTTRTVTGTEGEPIDPPQSDPADPPAEDPVENLPVPPVAPPIAPPASGSAPPALDTLADGQTLMLVGQTFQDEYVDFINGTGLTPAGSSHYSTFYLGQIEQGDDSPNAEFLDYVRENDLGDYAMVALSFKDNTPAGGYGQMINPDAADYDPNAIWDALNDIRNGTWDTQIDSFAQLMADRPDTQFLLRVGYEVSLLLFAYRGEEYVVDWLNGQANAGINVFENPAAVPEL